MSELNPYAKFLDGTPLEVVLASTPAALTEIINTIGPEKTTDPTRTRQMEPR